jgi:hypothetical protein
MVRMIMELGSSDKYTVITNVGEGVDDIYCGTFVGCEAKKT